LGARISAQDAAKRGLITKAEADAIDGAARGRKPATPGSPPTPPSNRPRSAAAEQLAAAKREGNQIPQRKLYDALCARLPGIPVWEREGLIDGRKFRADIFLPPDLVIEVEGYGFHSQLDAYKKDRLRSNLFVLAGFRVFRVFTKQCLDADMLCELVDQIAQAHLAPVCRQVSESIEGRCRERLAADG